MRNAGLGKSKNRKNKNESFRDFLKFMKGLGYTFYDETSYELASRDDLFIRASTLFNEAKAKYEKSFEKLKKYLYRKSKSEPDPFNFITLYKVAVALEALNSGVDLEAILFFLNEDTSGIIILKSLIARSKEAVELAILMFEQGFGHYAIAGFLMSFTDEEISKIKPLLSEDYLKRIKEHYEKALFAMFFLKDYLLVKAQAC